MVEDEKKVQREKIAQDIKDYLAKGGKVRQYSSGVSAYDKEEKTIWGAMPDSRVQIIRTKHKGK